MLKSEILREIGALSRSIHSINDAALRTYGLQRGQFPFLTRICESPGITPTQLAAVLRMDKTTTTKAVHKLVEIDLVAKEPDPRDKRGFRLFPTGEAPRLYQTILDLENHNIETCFAGFSPEEESLVLDLIRRMRENSDEEWQRLKHP